MKKSVFIIVLISVLIISCSKNEKRSKNLPKPVDQIQQTETIKTDTIHNKIEEQKTIEAQAPTQKKLSEIKEKISEKEITVQERWEKYRKYREESKISFNNSEFEDAISNLKMAAKYADQLDRDDLVAWQYNNIGYYSILEFKGRTNYDFKIHKLRTILNEDEKATYLAETKKSFSDNLKILTDAQEYLEKAYEIDERYSEQNRTDKIYSNLKFIDWVKNFITN